MTSIFFSIAMLCQLNVQLMVGLEDMSVIESKQLTCQKYYAECLKKATIFSDRTLAQCIVEK